MVIVLSNSFYTESEQGVAQAIIRGKIDFEREPWPSVSESAKNLVRQMLEPDPKLRLTAKQVLGTFALCALIFPLSGDCIFVSHWMLIFQKNTLTKNISKNTLVLISLKDSYY